MAIGGALHKLYLTDKSFDYTEFDAVAHVTVLHPSHRVGVFSFATPTEGGWDEWSVLATKGPSAAKTALASGSAVDLFISQQTFKGHRCVANLVSLGAVHCDIDYHDKKKAPDWFDKPIEMVEQAVLERMDDLRIPFPSCIISTGQGMLCIWLHDLLPRQALPRWMAVQRHIGGMLTEFGSDRNAVDAARLFRLCGSTNSKSGRQVRMIWCQGSVSNPTRHSFDTIAEEVLPFTQAEIKSLRVERAKKRADKAARKAAQGDQECGPKPARVLTKESYYETILTDLQLLKAHRWSTGAIPKGQRNVWVFLAACAVSWLTTPEAIEREVEGLLMEATGFNEREMRSSCSAAVKRARMALEKKTVNFGKKKVDPRYMFRAATIVEWLGITRDEMIGADLRVLVTKDIQADRKRVRKKKSRIRAGGKDRDEQRAERLRIGREAAYLRIKDGMSIHELAVKYQVSYGQMHKALKEASNLR